MSLLVLILMMIAWSGMLWGLAALVCRFGPSPKLAQAVWRTAALLMFAPLVAAQFMPALPDFQPIHIADMPIAEPVGEVLFAAPAMVQPGGWSLPSLTILLMAILFAGWTGRAVLWGISQYRLQRVKQASCLLNRPVAHWADAIGLCRVPDIRMTQSGAPFLAGICKPAVFIPAALIRREDSVQIIVHEMVHLKRGDLLLRPLERLVADIFWLSPFAWAMRERLDYWREAVIDQEAAEFTGDRFAYARALTRAARLSRPQTVLPVAAFILPKKGSLKMRLSHLLTEQTPRPRKLLAAVVGAACLIVPAALAQGAVLGGNGAAVTGVTFTHAVLDTAKVTSQFGERTHPITKEKKHHDGIDLAYAKGSPIYAPAAGVVTFAGEKGAYGNLVVLQFDDAMTMRFAQLDAINVSEGSSVSAGEIIGTLGESGRATGPHLHLEVWDGDARVDPESVDGLVLATELHEVAPKAPRAPKVPKEPKAPKDTASTVVVDEIAPEAPEAPEAPVPPAAPESE